MEIRAEAHYDVSMKLQTFTVSEYLDELNEGLKKFSGRVKGETTQVKHAASGHVYFSLKDASGEGILRCAIWRSNYSISGIELTDGLEIIVSGTPNIYAPRGELSFIVRTVELFGEGELQKAYRELKAKLEAEGVFAEERKRPLPTFPKHIGVITSREGEVIHDFLMNIGKHGFAISFIHSGVEGKEAVFPLLRAIKRIRRVKLDVLVIMRGGGSFESLQGFDNETLVREIIKFPCPVIAAIGHHRDVPLVSLAADIMVSTPTAAAEALSTPWAEALANLRTLEHRTVSGFERVREESREMLFRLEGDLERGSGHIFEVAREPIRRFHENVRIIELAFKEQKNALKNWGASLRTAFARKAVSARDLVRASERTLISHDPERQLGLGWSIAKIDGKILRKKHQAKAGKLVAIRVSDGTIVTEVSNTLL
jgi:exodeoxyribonuclease VII large subunit